jgi:hypothetical protein
MRLTFTIPRGQQSGQILFQRKSLRIRTNTHKQKLPKTDEDFANIAAADQKWHRKLNQQLQLATR